MSSISLHDQQKKIALCSLYFQLFMTNEQDEFDDDDEDDDYLLDELLVESMMLQLRILCMIYDKNNNPIRQITDRPTNIFNDIFNNWEEQRFHENFRMNRDYFAQLCEELTAVARPEEADQKDWAEWHPRTNISIEAALLVFLYSFSFSFFIYFFYFFFFFIIIVLCTFT